MGHTQVILGERPTFLVWSLLPSLLLISVYESLYCCLRRSCPWEFGQESTLPVKLDTFPPHMSFCFLLVGDVSLPVIDDLGYAGLY